jgi:hypothetical protein
MSRKQLGWRLPRLLVTQFVGLCRQGGLRPSEVVEEFMRRAVAVGDVAEALGVIEARGAEAALARRLRAEALIASLEGRIQANDFQYDDRDEYWELLQLLPLLHDAELVEAVKRLSEQVKKLLRA